MRNRKPLFYIIGLILVQAFSYFCVKITPFKTVVLSSKIDDAIPFIPFFTYFYVFWYLMLLLVPLLLYKKDKKTFNRYVVTVFTCLIICALVFFFYPTMIIRPEIKGFMPSSLILRIIYFFDSPAMNCMPSIHCLICFMFIYTMIGNKKINKKMKLFIEIMSILIIFSTFFIKQHVILDAVSALFLSSIVYFIVIKLNLGKLLDKKA